MAIRTRHHDGCACQQREHPLPHGHIKADCRLLQDAIIGPKVHHALAPRQMFADALGCDANSFRHAGAAGCIYHVCQSFRMERPDSLGGQNGAIVNLVDAMDVL